ncbi:MAG TPA: SIMPL domain-containing protein [Denitromonas sp.]|nr:SIMPL domain-containing protein [Denitromonas sp.]
MDEKARDLKAAAIAGLAVIIGLVLASWLIARGMSEFRMADRYVSVKGLAEQYVKADLALWNIRFVATSDLLEEAQGKIDSDQASVISYLKDKGFSPEEVSPGTIEVVDLLAQQYRSDGASRSRYIVKASVGVRTNKVALVDEVSRKTGDLVRKGVVLEETYVDGGSGPRYIFTKLNDIKPAMIAEATANARKAAEQFAKDSRSRLGKIRRANQGVFMILGRDADERTNESRQIDKKVRVVSTVDYGLVN